jgi:hypothetical protein
MAWKARSGLKPEADLPVLPLWVLAGFTIIDAGPVKHTNEIEASARHGGAVG